MQHGPYATTMPERWRKKWEAGDSDYSPEEWKELEPDAALPKLQSFWKRNRARVRFNPATRRFE